MLTDVKRKDILDKNANQVSKKDQTAYDKVKTKEASLKSRLQSKDVKINKVFEELKDFMNTE